jgi:polyhydroxybutyrate depolymerase
MKQRNGIITAGVVLGIIVMVSGLHENTAPVCVNHSHHPLIDYVDEWGLSPIEHLHPNVSQVTDYRPHFMIHDGRVRSYYLHVSHDYKPGIPSPLLVALHAGGSFALRLQQKTNLSDMGDKYGFIIAYPNGVARFNPLWRMWNGGYCCGIAYERDVDDVGYIRALIGHIQHRYDINSSRIYITGHSNGAILAYRVAAELSDLIAAASPVAGSIGGQASENGSLYVIPIPQQPVSIIAFHGMLDENVPYNGGQDNNTWTTCTDLSVNESIAFWVNHNNCTPFPETTISQSGNIIINRYSDGDDDTEVILYTVVNGGHGWPGSNIGDRPTKEISASALMCDFFFVHSKKAIN